MVQRLNSGALPVPIKLVSQQNIESSLGSIALDKSLKAGLYAFLAVAIFMILWYRIPGLLAVFALGIYTVLLLAVYKLFGVTLTLAGIAGVILFIGVVISMFSAIFVTRIFLKGFIGTWAERFNWIWYR